MGGLWACQCIVGNGKLRYFQLAFFCPSKFLIGKPHPVPYRQRTHFWLKKNFSRSVEAFSQTDVKTNVYKRMLSSRLPWQLDLFSSQTKTFISEITGRIRAWKQADSCSEDIPLAIQIGQCLLLVGFNGKFAFFTVGRCTIFIASEFVCQNKWRCMDSHNRQDGRKEEVNRFHSRI